MGELPLFEWDHGAQLGVRAVWTSRAGGVSTGKYHSLNLGGQDDAASIIENRHRLAVQLGRADLSDIRVATQVHGSQVVSAHAISGSPFWNADAATEADGILLDGQLGAAIFTADCMSIVIASSPPTYAVALHAGWKGVAQGILEKSVRALREAVGRGPELYAAIGPSLGPCCFDANDEIALAIDAQATHNESDRREEVPVWRNKPPRHGGVHPNDPQSGLRRLFIDAPAVARRRLVAAGVEHVDVAPICTACDARWFSYRAEGPDCGRQALVVLPLAGQG